jgi:hypothetical protein
MGARDGGTGTTSMTDGCLMALRGSRALEGGVGRRGAGFRRTPHTERDSVVAEAVVVRGADVARLHGRLEHWLLRGNWLLDSCRLAKSRGGMSMGIPVS